MPANAIVYNGYTYQFISIHGFPDPPGESLKRIEKAGASGYAFKSMGYHAEPSQLQITSLSTAAGLSSDIAAMKALQGKSVTLWTPHGIYFTDIVIERWHVDRAKRVVGTLWNNYIYSGNYIVTSSVLVTYPYGS